MKNRAIIPASFVFFVVLTATLIFTPISDAYATKNASLVIDANSGKVLHADDASEQRYPASLTKLMTLYMTFDALRTGQLRLDTVLVASEKAASMPSTNLRMKAGDKITVRDAIKALVVRSANDVAVILAERLAGSEYNFARRMTAVARHLGMKNTTFKNASGLPNRQQISTARDMAVLALALRRHYPEYYPYFRTTTFKYKGQKYTSHNKAMRRINGADGLKTGYIRASGFNLVTSATRHGKSVVAVVLGGSSSKQRDDKMVKLVERTFARMNLQSNRRQFVLNSDPVPRQKPQELIALAQQEKQHAANKIPPQYASFEAKPAVAAPKQYIKFDFGGDEGLEGQQFTPPSPEKSAYDEEIKAFQKQQRGQFMPISYQPSDNNSPFNVKPRNEWGVQVGAYKESREALVAASNAASIAPKLLNNATIHVTDKQKVNNEILYRARLANMTKSQAKEACALLEASNTACFVYRERNSNI